MTSAGCQVRRVHLRFPTLLPPGKHPASGHPVGPPHDHTLLDGETLNLVSIIALTAQCQPLLVYLAQEQLAMLIATCDHHMWQWQGLHCPLLLVAP